MPARAYSGASRTGFRAEAEQHSGVGQKVFGFSPESCSTCPGMLFGLHRNTQSVRKLYNSPGPAYRKNLGSGPPTKCGIPEAPTVVVITQPLSPVFTFLCFTVTLPPVNVPCQNWPPGTNVSSLNCRLASQERVQ